MMDIFHHCNIISNGGKKDASVTKRKAQKSRKMIFSESELLSLNESLQHFQWESGRRTYVYLPAHA